MSKNTSFYIALFSTLAVFIGWRFAIFRGTAEELATRVRQVEILKDARGRALARVALIAVLFAVILYVVATKHHHG
jgi:hypothetical protein